MQTPADSRGKRLAVFAATAAPKWTHPFFVPGAAQHTRAQCRGTRVDGVSLQENHSGAPMSVRAADGLSVSTRGCPPLVGSEEGLPLSRDAAAARRHDKPTLGAQFVYVNNPGTTRSLRKDVEMQV